MADNTNSAAMQMASLPMKVETLSLPGFGGGSSASAIDPNGFRVRYGKYDLDDMGSTSELEIIETRGLFGKDIVVLSKDKFVFMDKYFLVVTYLERIPEF